MENFEEPKIAIPEGLSPEEEKIWRDIIDLELSYASDSRMKIISREVREGMQEKIINFGKELKGQGMDPARYLLWHKLIGSSGAKRKDLEFDLDDHRIEIFTRKIYAEYKQ